MKYLLRLNKKRSLKQPTHKRPPYKQQCGAALVVALLIVFIVASLAVTVSSDFLVMFRRVENQVHGQQAYAYLVGAEGLGRWAVLQDEDWDFDHPSEPFLIMPIAFVNEIAQFSGVLSDMQGRFNINNLVSANSDQTGNYTVNQERFIRLLQTLTLESPLDLASAEALANAVFDWLDVDDIERQPGGAETLYYSEATPPGRAANGPIQSVSELRWVKGITAELYEALLPHITVFGSGKININTATEPVLRSMNKIKNLSPLAVIDVADIVAGQSPEQGGFDDITVFNQPPLAGLEIAVEDLVVNSELFLLTTNVLLLEREYQLQSIIFRENDTAKVIARSQQGF